MPLLVTSIAESPDSLSEVSTSSATEDLSNITIESSASGSGTEATEDVFFTFPETQFPSNGSQVVVCQVCKNACLHGIA